MSTLAKYQISLPVKCLNMSVCENGKDANVLMGKFGEISEERHKKHCKKREKLSVVIHSILDTQQPLKAMY